MPIPFIGRRDERRLLEELLDGVRDGRSGTLVLAGEPGTGKTSLLDRAAASGPDVRVVRIAGVESETVLGFAALHRLLRPWLDRVDALPAPQRDALHTAFGRVAGVPADRYLAGMAVLTLLAEAAAAQPLLCIVDDAHWLDRASAEVLAFVARRLHAEGVGLLFATRPPVPGVLDGLPVLTVAGMPSDDAGSLLAAGITGRIDGAVAARIVDGTGGNPLALVELARALTAEQLSGAAPLPRPLPVGTLLETHYQRQIAALPDDTRALLLLVSATPPEEPALLWRAAAHLGIAADHVDPALSAGILTDTLDFRHPLIRSATYRGGSAAGRRRVHAALAAVSDPVHDADRRAWHRAEATIGLDEDVAADLERASERARARGGIAEQAAFLSRAADLTPAPRDQAARMVAAARALLALGDPAAAGAMLDRAERDLDGVLPRALALQARATAQMQTGRFTDVPGILLEAAASIADRDAALARRMMFEALQAVLISDDRVTAATLHELSRAVLASPAIGAPAPSYADLFLTGYATRAAVGYREAVPLMRDALAALEAATDLAEERLPLAVICAFAAEDVWDDAAGRRAWQRIEAHDRDGVALWTLRTTLMVGATWEMRAGRFAAAYARHDELAALADVVGRRHPVIQRVELLAWSGRDAEARAAATADLGFDDVIRNCLAVLDIGLGRYAEALAALLPSFARDMPGVANRALHDIVEAGVRGGNRAAAAAALARMEERVPVAGTPWGLGLLARCRALLAGDDTAEALYQESAAQLARTEMAVELARTYLLHGEWLRRVRRRADARVALRTALDMFTGMGAAAFAERARAELTATGERPQSREVHSSATDVLTPQERQVATLAASGATNTEIAARLFLSNSTVEYHLTKIFRKLDITSRRRLAAVL
ncbi:helix-turn-helix transcriptional regulator [Catenuloplanes japonicus]|uniref:helix-turn-helix transcriptional regulator n=1 Tax=Catenuloplanes japonicus TaxID=33876 RepID=UPI00068AC415|nr:LuxR family transcriptional regulator [Catenuloplanes japonicus]